MVPPHAGDLVDQRLQRVANCCATSRMREIRGDEGVGQRAERQRDEHEEAHAPSPTRSPRGQSAVGARAHQTRDRHHQRQRQREAQRQLAHLAGH